MSSLSSLASLTNDLESAARSRLGNEICLQYRRVAQSGVHPARERLLFEIDRLRSDATSAAPRDNASAIQILALRGYQALAMSLLAGWQLGQIAGVATASTALGIARRCVDQQVLAAAGIEGACALEPCEFDVVLDDQFAGIAHGLWTLLDRAVSHPDMRYLPGLLSQALSPSAQRREFGEFFTPRWVVDLALERLGWPTDLEHVLVDPTCGAGAFLIEAIGRLQRACETLPQDERAGAIVQSVRGFELNSLTVQAAQTAYLRMLSPFLPGKLRLKIPVQVRDLFGVTAQAMQADVLIGNPPWVRWSSVPGSQRAKIAQCARDLGLVPKTSYFGGSQLDIAAIAVNQACRCDLRAGGKACFVLPATLLRSPAAREFRKFALGGGQSLGVDWIIDFGSRRVFGDAQNCTAMIAWTKGMPSTYPALASIVEHLDRNPVDPLESLDHARPRLALHDATAYSVGREGRIVVRAAMQSDLGSRLGGETTWLKARKGITTDLNGAFFVRVVGPGSTAERLTVANDIVSRGHQVPAHVFEIERKLVFPLCKGSKEIRAFSCRAPRVAAIIPNLSIRPSEILADYEFKLQFPLAFAHFCWIEHCTGGALSARSTYRTRLASQGLPYWTVYNVGPYSLAPYKVVWAEISASFCAAVIGSAKLGDAELSIVMPDHKVYFAPFFEPEAAHFVCGLLNSQLVRAYVHAVGAKLQLGTLFGWLRLPEFSRDNPRHQELAHRAESLARASKILFVPITQTDKLAGLILGG